MTRRARAAWGAALVTVAAAGVAVGEPRGAASASRAPVVLPAGEMIPFFAPRPARGAQAGPRGAVAVPTFAIDATPVTNAELASFLVAAPAWRRSRIARVFAEETYLARWAGDLDLGRAAAAAPVTHVSWFVAQAFCRARGGALPTTLQWEYALEDGGRGEAERRELLLAWFSQPSTQEPGAVAQRAPNGYGVHDLAGLVWEWTLDFGADSLGGESRTSGTRDEALVCGAGSLGARDPGDYATFMRYAFRASLRATFTTGNLGFRCAYPVVTVGAPATRPAKGAL